LHKRKLALALFAVLAIAVIVAGCGGGSDSTSGGGSSSEAESQSGEAPTKAAFIKEADAICSKADGELNEEVTEYAKEHNIPTNKEPSKQVQGEIYAAIVLPNVGRQGEEIGELTAPEGDEETIEELVESLASGVEEGEEDPEGLTEGKNPLADASAQAKAYGMKQCGAE
jgi:hypothetical protein